MGGFIVDCSKGEIDAMTDGMIKMMEVFVEIQRNMISERVKISVANARIKGKVIGRLKITLDNFIRHYPKYKENQFNKCELARVCGFSRQTIYKYIQVYEGRYK